MSTSAQPSTGAPDIGEEQVLEFLRETPDFFQRHPEIAAELRVPHGETGTVSLVEHQLRVMREQLAEERGRLAQLIANARDNEELGQRMHRLTLQLVDCRTLDEILSTLYGALSEQFAADAAAMRLLCEPRAVSDRGLGEFVGAGSGAETLFEPVLAEHKPVCGRLAPAQAEFLFDSRAAHIASAAVLPLGAAGRLGLLAIGSRDPQRFHPGMGTVFLRNLAEVLSCMLRPHLQSPPA